MTQKSNKLTLAWTIFIVVLATFAAVTRWHYGSHNNKGIKYQCRVLIDELEFEKHKKADVLGSSSATKNTDTQTSADNSPNIEEFYEYSKYGRIPKISPDGLRVLDVCSAKIDLPTDRKIVHLVVQVGDALLDSLIKNLEMLQNSKVTFVIPHYHDNLHEIVDVLREKGHEFMLQIPTQFSIPDSKKSTISPFLANSEKDDLLAKLLCLLASTKHVIGIANTCATLLMKSSRDMNIIREELLKRGLVFLDLADSGELLQKFVPSLTANLANSTVCNISLKEGKVFFTHIDMLKDFLSEFAKQSDYVIAPASAMLKK